MSTDSLSDLVLVSVESARHMADAYGASLDRDDLLAVIFASVPRVRPEVTRGELREALDALFLREEAEDSH